MDHIYSGNRVSGSSPYIFDAVVFSNQSPWLVKNISDNSSFQFSFYISVEMAEDKTSVVIDLLEKLSASEWKTPLGKALVEGKKIANDYGAFHVL